MNKKTILITTIAITTTLLLAWCWNKANETQKNNNNDNTITKKEINQTIDNAKVKVNPKEIKEYIEWLKIYTKCISTYCKTEYEQLKDNKVALKYFNELVKKNKAEKIIQKNIKTTKEEVINKIKTKWIKTQWDCAKVSKDYTNIAECIYKNHIQNNTKQKLINKFYWKKIWNITLDKDLTFWNMMDSVCSFWKDHQFKSIKEINKELEPQRKKWFDVKNTIIVDMKDFKRIYHLNTKEYQQLITNMCRTDIYDYNKISNQTKKTKNNK